MRPEDMKSSYFSNVLGNTYAQDFLQGLGEVLMSILEHVEVRKQDQGSDRSVYTFHRRQYPEDLRRPLQRRYGDEDL